MEQFTRRGALALSLGSAAFVMGCGSKFITYRGPEVTRVEVQKSNRAMYLFHHNVLLEPYQVQLGFTAAGPKQFEGDGKTPEGRYHIDRRNPDSSFYLSIGIDYPNNDDRAFAESMGKKPGGDIFIHGWGDKRRGRGDDWTAGCIAVTNREMKMVYAMVRNGTPVDIFA
ncbi:L,D-transpeptidase family protein [Jannaschia marina]|uniref:L,D-transpeptidase family protein n=1 Tax=Jannaschia marina TaxID=2741674 RepID=UPI0015C6A9D9|nr:L,D-transpeptidase family protein [Jannaschia marina]